MGNWFSGDPGKGKKFDGEYSMVPSYEKKQLDYFPYSEEESSEPPQITQQVVLAKSDSSMIDKRKVVKGYDFNKGVNYEELFRSYLSIGFQATNVGKAIQIINKMLNWRLKDEKITRDTPKEYLDRSVRESMRCKIFLGYTSNLVSSGLRDIFRFLVEHKLVDCIVTSAGGIEEDLMKCLDPFYVGEFRLSGSMLHKKRVNRIGNLLVPNNNYVNFKKWIFPILDQLLEEQKLNNETWTPSKVIRRLGKEIQNQDSIVYWSWKNKIPIYCPGFTDGAIGDCLYFHSYKNPGLIIDVVKDIKLMNNETVFAKTLKTGMILLGGGTSKHHILNANLMRGGASYSVFINTGFEFDGSDSGARPDEAVSWGKIKIGAEATKVYSDATVVFPIIVAETFAKYLKKQKN